MTLNPGSASSKRRGDAAAAGGLSAWSSTRARMAKQDGKGSRLELG